MSYSGERDNCTHMALVPMVIEPNLHVVIYYDVYSRLLRNVIF